MKFHNPCMHGSSKSVTDGHTWMDRHTHKHPRSNMPLNFFEVGGIITKKNKKKKKPRNIGSIKFIRAGHKLT